MLQLLAVILFIAALVVAAKVALLVLILAGLIFRTKETVCLLLFGGFLTFLNVHPILGFGGLGIIGIFAFCRRKKPAEAPALSAPETTTQL